MKTGHPSARGIEPPPPVDGRWDIPSLRVSAENRCEVHRGGAYVLYWMIAQRRTTHSFALQRALGLAQALNVPVLVFEALRVGYRWASARIHRFVMDGMLDNLDEFTRHRVTYFPYVEREVGEGQGLLEALARNAAVVVTDEFPCFFLPRMVAAAARRVEVRLESVDGNGVLPLRAGERAHPTAYAFRRHLHRVLIPHLLDPPIPEPLEQIPLDRPAVIPPEVLGRWPATSRAQLESKAFLEALPIDASVRPAEIRGGSRAASAGLQRFLAERLDRYGADRSHPDDDVASGLSPYLHFGHIGVHEVVARILVRDHWTPENLSGKPNGRREGFYGFSANSESFFDELVTWRELGYGFCHYRPEDYDRYESLPTWARDSLDSHREDPRDPVYSLETLASAATHDLLWNAAQRQLSTEGRLQNYLRMLWGKKILEWSATPEAALEAMIELNNRYAVDGRNPNSYSGIFWTLGRFDRPWAPQRPIFGVIRYMSSTNTARKLRLRGYLERHGANRATDLFG